MPADALELNAAEALMELHFGPSRPPKDIKVEVEGTDRLPVSGLPTPNTPINSQCSYGRPIAHTTDTYKNLELIPKQTCMNVQQVQQAGPNTERAPQSPLNGGESLYNPINLARKDTSTQGNLTNKDLSQNMSPTSTSGIKKDKMGVIVSVLYSSISSLEMQLKEYQKNLSFPSRSELDPYVSADVQIEKYIKQDYIPGKSSSCKTFQFDTTAIESDSDDEWQPEHHVSSKQIPHIQVSLKPRNKDMVPIGEGHASVPARLLKQIDWSSYTIATRKLLTAVFSRRVLATHSLTGKPSPAFPGKPVKKRLNTDLVNDIVQTVVERCGVPESVVRTSITTKCADESKMYRNRQQQKQKHWFRSNHENVPPCRYDDSSSE